MSANQACFPVATMARVLGVSKAGFYAWLHRAPSARAVADAALLQRVCQRRRKNQPNGGAKVCQFWWGFLVRLEAVSSSRPDVFGASRTAAVKDGRRPPRSGAQRP